MIEILLMVLFAVVAFLIGLFSISAILPSDSDAFQKILYAFPLGIGINTIVFYSLNTLFKVKLTSYLVWIILFVLLIIAFAIFHAIKKRDYHLNQGYFKQLLQDFKNLALLYKLIAALIFILIFAMLIHALIVPIYKHDAFLYHLPIAKETFITGHYPSQISASYLEFERAYPPLGYFSYALFYLAMGKENLLIVKLLPFIYGIILLGAVFHITRFILKKSTETAIIAIILVLASYYFSNMAIFENTDIYTGFYYVAAASFLLQFFQSYNPQYFYLSAIMAAMSYWTKYTSLIWITSFSIVSIFLYFRTRGRVRMDMSKTFLIGAVFGLLLVLPHLLRNYLITGNPLFPLFESMLGNGDSWYVNNVLSVFMPQLFQQAPIGILFRQGILVFPLLISWIMLSPKEFPEKFLFGVAAVSAFLWAIFLEGHSVFAPNTYLYLIGPYLLACVVASQAFMDFLSKKPLRISKGISLAYLIFLFFLAASFFVPEIYGEIGYTRVSEYTMAIAVLIILSFYPFVPLKRAFAQAQFGIVLIVLVPFTLSLAVYPLKFTGTGELGKDIAYSYYEPSYSWMKENLSPDDLILTFHERLYLFPASYIPVDSPKIIEAYQTQSLDKAVKILSENGVTHIFISEHSKEIPLFGKSMIFQNLDGNYFTKVFSENESELKVSIYRINYSAN